VNDDIAIVEALAFRAWPAEFEHEVDGWILRHSPGINARRINSATTPLGSASDPVGAVRMVREWSEECGIQPVVRTLSVSDPAIDRHLADDGWEYESPTLTMARRLSSSAGSDDVLIEDRPSAAWTAAKQRLTGMSDTMIASWLRRAGAIDGATGFASLRRAGEIVTIGLGVVQDGWLGLFDLNTDPARRRQRMARTAVRALEAWACDLDASTAYLQVEASNDAAIGLYAQAQYAPLYDYWYRRAPVDPRSSSATSVTHPGR
jgi:ribosomal protein S18 acetylase RimI-like enzyme